jgi:hypothetical protein
MGNLWTFIVAVLASWVSLMSGIASVLFAIWLDRAKQSSIPSKVFWAVGILSIFVAFYQAWKKEHAAVVALRRSHEYNLQGSIIDAVSRELAGHTVFIARIEISNLGQPTIVDNYEMDLETSSGKFTGKVFIPMQDTMLVFPGAGQLLLNRDGCIVEKTASTPLQTGMKVGGYLGVTIDELNWKALNESVITIKFKDISHNQYRVSLDTTGRGKAERLAYIPSIGGPIVPVVLESPQSPKRDP